MNTKKSDVMGQRLASAVDSGMYSYHELLEMYIDWQAQLICEQVDQKMIDDILSICK